jgi:hypothetical protein
VLRGKNLIILRPALHSVRKAWRTCAPAHFKAKYSLLFSAFFLFLQIAFAVDRHPEKAPNRPPEWAPLERALPHAQQIFGAKRLSLG